MMMSIGYMALSFQVDLIQPHGARHVITAPPRSRLPDPTSDCDRRRPRRASKSAGAYAIDMTCRTNPNEEEEMQITRRLVSRRNVLTGIAAAPTLALAGAPIGVLAEEVDATAARAKAALKDAKGTKLVLLGTGS